MGFMAGAMGALGQQMLEDRKQKTLMDFERQKYMSGMLAELSQNQNLTQDQSQRLQQLSIGMLTGAYKPKKGEIEQTLADIHGNVTQRVAAQQAADQEYRRQVAQAANDALSAQQAWAGQAGMTPQQAAGLPLSQTLAAALPPPPPSVEQAQGMVPPVAPQMPPTLAQIATQNRIAEDVGRYRAQYGAMAEERMRQRREDYEFFRKQGLSEKEAAYLAIGKGVPGVMGRFVPGIIPGDDPRIAHLGPDPQKMYRGRIDAGGNITDIYEQATPVGSMRGAVHPDAESETGYSLDILSKDGKTVVSKYPVMPPAGFAPLVTTNTREIIAQTPEGPVRTTVSGSSTRQRITPGGAPTIPPPPGSAAPGPAGAPGATKAPVRAPVGARRTGGGGALDPYGIRSQETVNNYVDEMLKNPRVWEDKAIDSAKIRSRVAAAWTKKTGLPPPSKVSAQNLASEENARIALRHLSTLYTMMQDPYILANLGPLAGREQNFEQWLGKSFKGTPEQREKAQAFRQALTYFFMREGKAVLSGRPAERLMGELQRTSPRVQMEPSMMWGALKSAEQAAKQTLIAVEQSRFDGKTRPGYIESIQLPIPEGGAAGRPKNPYE